VNVLGCVRATEGTFSSMLASSICIMGVGWLPLGLALTLGIRVPSVASKDDSTNSQKRPDSASSVGSRTKTRSPFVTPGNTDYSDREEVAYSPFQPQDTQSLSIVNRGYSPDIGDVGPVFPHTHRKSLPVLAEDGSIVPQTDRTSVPNVANKGNVSSFKHKPVAVPTKPIVLYLYHISLVTNNN
jgi:hypothetical protein